MSRYSSAASVASKGTLLLALMVLIVAPVHAEPGKYLEVRRSWRPADHVQLSFPMPIERVACHPYVMENADRVALKRGPLVYCVEEVDNPDCDPWRLILPSVELDYGFG